jgi:Domain of unknown function (DUF1707)
VRCAWYRAWRCFKVLSMAESEPGGEIARSELRASHDDRDRVVEMLRVSAGDGRLTAEELDDRLEQAMTARTYGELARLVADLPTAGPVASPAVAPQVKDVVRIDTRSGHVKRVDRWVVPQRMEVKVTSGHGDRGGRRRRDHPQRRGHGEGAVGFRRTGRPAHRGHRKGGQRAPGRPAAEPELLAVADQAAQALHDRHALT